MSLAKSTSCRTQRCRFFLSASGSSHITSPRCASIRSTESLMVQSFAYWNVSVKCRSTVIYPPRIFNASSGWQKPKPMPKLVHVSLFVLRPDGSPYTSTKSARVVAYSYISSLPIYRRFCIILDDVQIVAVYYTDDFKIFVTSPLHQRNNYYYNH